jgi:CheY-like chemotaxis protein
MNQHLDQLIARRGHKPKILVVDDQPINIRVIHGLFKSQFDVVMAMNGEQALSQAEQHRPDLIILDVMMPDMDGYEVCRRLKASSNTSAIPVVFVTAHNDAADEIQGIALGAIDFISKPINAVLVEARVKTYITFKLQTDLLRSLGVLDELANAAHGKSPDE